MSKIIVLIVIILIAIVGYIGFNYYNVTDIVTAPVVEQPIDELDILEEELQAEEEKTYTDYLIEKDAGIHDNKTSTDKEVILEELEELLKEESTNEQNNETSAIVPNIHTS